MAKRGYLGRGSGRNYEYTRQHGIENVHIQSRLASKVFPHLVQRWTYTPEDYKFPLETATGGVRGMDDAIRLYTQPYEPGWSNYILWKVWLAPDKYLDTALVSQIVYLQYYGPVEDFAVAAPGNQLDYIRVSLKESVTKWHELAEKT